MSTTQSFNNMLKEYLPYTLLREEVEKRNYFLQKVEKDMNWKGGELSVPFKGNKASSFKFGGLTAEANITEDGYVRGTVSTYKELWGSMVFNDKDLHQHGDLKQSFIKILPDTIDMFVDSMGELVSQNLLNGASFATVTGVVNAATGHLQVDRIERFSLGMYIKVGDKVGWVRAINMNTSDITVYNAISGGAAVDFTAAVAIVAGDIFYIDGADTDSFTSLPSQLLSQANGGTATLFGQTKTSYPHLQAHNFDGSAVTASNLLAKIFDFYNETRRIGKGNPTDVLMSYKHLANCMKVLEVARDYTATDKKASVYGWTEIDVVGVKGKLKLVGINEMDDDNMLMLDWRSMKLHSNGMFERRRSPEGKEYYEVRSTTGYKYIVDTRFFGELVTHTPSYNGIMYGVNY